MGTFSKDDYKKLGSITAVIGLLLGAFKLKFKGPGGIPAPLLHIGGRLKQGLSAQEIAANIIRRHAEIGVPNGDLPDGSKNLSVQLEKARVEEITEAILTRAKITTVIPPGVSFTGGGVGAVKGATDSYTTTFSQMT